MTETSTFDPDTVAVGDQLLWTSDLGHTVLYFHYTVTAIHAPDSPLPGRFTISENKPYGSVKRTDLDEPSWTGSWSKEESPVA